MSPGAKAKVAVAVLAAVALAKPAEGIYTVAYRDPPGIWTVCWGHTGPDVVPGKRYTMAECERHITADMTEAVTTVARCAPGAPHSVLVAFGDAVFNLGPRIACDRANSTAARMLADERWADACNQLPRWDKARMAGVLVALPGLVKRRARDRAVCLSGL